MIKYLLLCLSTWTVFSQTSNPLEIGGLTIDPSIKEKVEIHIKASEDFEAMKSVMQIYENAVLCELYENDTLSFSNNDVSKKMLFKSFYFWKDGKLGIDGAFGIFGSAGFHIVIENNKAHLYHMLSSDDFPTYAYDEKSDMIDRLEVPCTDTKIILSEIPDSTKKQIIYGYVEFKSDSYYGISGAYSKNQTPLRKKYRSTMRIYFRSGFLNL